MGKLMFRIMGAVFLAVLMVAAQGGMAFAGWTEASPGGITTATGSSVDHVLIQANTDNGATGNLTLQQGLSAGGSLTILDSTPAGGVTLNMNTGSIINAGAVSGVTTLGMSGALTGATDITASGTVQGATLTATGAATVGTTLGVTGALTANGGITADGGVFTVTNDTGAVFTNGTLTVNDDIANLNGGIAVDTNKFTVADGTGNTAIAGTLDVTGATTLTGALTANGGVGTTTLTTSGTTTLGDQITDATTVSGTLGVTGATTLTGALAADGGASVENGFEAYSGAGVGNSIVVDATSVEIASQDASHKIEVANGANTITGSTNVNGVTTITSTGSANQMIVDATSSRFVSNNTNYQLGVSDSGVAATTGVVGHNLMVTATTTTINGTATINSGNADGHQLIVDATSSRLVSDSGNRSVAVNDTSVTVASASGSNSIVVREDRTTTVNSNTVTYGTEVTGGMLVNGDLGVNGNIYSLNSSANIGVAVNNNGLTVTGTTNTVSLTSDDDATTGNGRAQLNLTPTTGSLQVVNTTTGNSHGVEIGQTQTVLSGGTTSTSLTLNDDGATFRNDSTGGPARVTGVADGGTDYDAVNYKQLKEFSRQADAGIASVAALAAIPGPVPGKNYSIGAGVGHHNNEDAMAVGVATIVGKNKDISLKAGLGYSRETFTTNAGVSWSF